MLEDALGKKEDIKEGISELSDGSNELVKGFEAADFMFFVFS